MTPLNLKSWQRPEILLYLFAAAVPISFSVWQSLLNNFAIEQAAFTGVEMGILQSLREIPGFLSFLVVFVLLIMKEQTLAFISMLVLGIGTAITGLFPSVIGLYLTTVLMSIGFHYFETVKQSLSLQWLDKKTAAHGMGKIIAVGSFVSLLSYGLVYVTIKVLQLSMPTVYLLGGGITVILALYCWFTFPLFPQHAEQKKTLVLRRRYWLYYALEFMSGARRQIFVVFAGFLMVEKFGFDASAIAAMFLINGALNMFFAPKIGKLILHWGERKTLTIEYIGLIMVFLAYAVVENPWVAVGLYIVDHLFFSMAIAMKTYFQKIADPTEIAPTAGVSFTINHIAAVVLPALYGLLWLVSPALVFVSGAILAGGSLLLSRLIPTTPEEGNEVEWPVFLQRKPA
ncbi:MAG: MFS transporter [Thiolinea sp.]